MTKCSVDLIWGTAVQFGEKDKDLYMIYYGFFLFGLFIGVSFLLKSDLNKQNKLKPQFV